MKTRVLTTLAILAGTMAQADGHYSDLLATKGLSGTQTELEEIAEPTPADQFTLGGVQFLSAIEGALQTRYTYGMSDELTMFLDLPLLRLPIYDNPTPDEFTTAVVDDIFTNALLDFESALTSLDAIEDDTEFKVAIDTADIWFDINMNGNRDAYEGLYEVVGMNLDRALSNDFTPPIVGFDTADAAWLSAYAHVLSGISEVILAFDPATALDAAFISGEAMDELRATPFVDNYYFLGASTPHYVDLIATFLNAVQSEPDAQRSRAAHAHFLSMIADNKVFWERVSAETDNDNEWIPNKNQQSILPLEFPADLGPRWQAVLADAEKLLNGDLLLPHWRLGENAGVDLNALMQNPPALDIIGILQGTTILPFAKEGQLIDNRSLRQFSSVVGGDSPLYIVILN